MSDGVPVSGVAAPPAGRCKLADPPKQQREGPIFTGIDAWRGVCQFRQKVADPPRRVPELQKGRPRATALSPPSPTTVTDFLAEGIVLKNSKSKRRERRIGHRRTLPSSLPDPLHPQTKGICLNGIPVLRLHRICLNRSTRLVGGAGATR